MNEQIQRTQICNYRRVDHFGNKKGQHTSWKRSFKKKKGDIYIDTTSNPSHETENKTHPCHHIRGILKKPTLVTITTNFHEDTGFDTDKHLRHRIETTPSQRLFRPRVLGLRVRTNTSLRWSPPSFQRPPSSPSGSLLTRSPRSTVVNITPHVPMTRGF